MLKWAVAPEDRRGFYQKRRKLSFKLNLTNDNPPITESKSQNSEIRPSSLESGSLFYMTLDQLPLAILKQYERMFDDKDTKCEEKKLFHDPGMVVQRMDVPRIKQAVHRPLPRANQNQVLFSNQKYSDSEEDFKIPSEIVPKWKQTKHKKSRNVHDTTDPEFLEKLSPFRARCSLKRKELRKLEKLRYETDKLSKFLRKYYHDCLPLLPPEDEVGGSPEEKHISSFLDQLAKTIQLWDHNNKTQFSDSTTDSSESEPPRGVNELLLPPIYEDTEATSSDSTPPLIPDANNTKSQQKTTNHEVIAKKSAKLEPVTIAKFKTAKFSSKTSNFEQCEPISALPDHKILNAEPNAYSGVKIEKDSEDFRRMSINSLNLKKNCANSEHLSPMALKHEIKRSVIKFAKTSPNSPNLGQTCSKLGESETSVAENADKLQGDNFGQHKEEFECDSPEINRRAWDITPNLINGCSFSEVRDLDAFDPPLKALNCLTPRDNSTPYKTPQRKTKESQFTPRRRLKKKVLGKNHMKTPTNTPTGEVLVRIYKNENYVTLHVIEGKFSQLEPRLKFSGSWMLSFKISFVGDDIDEGVVCSEAIEVIKPGRVPINQKFSLEEGESRKKIFLTFWRKSERKRSSFIGWTTLDLQTQKFNRDFHLRLRKKKMMRRGASIDTTPVQVHHNNERNESPHNNNGIGLDNYLFTHKPTLQNSATMDSGVEDCCNNDHHGNSNHQHSTHGTHLLFKITKPQNAGFGFTVVWSNPPKIGRLEKDQSAEVAGIRTGDLITGVNGEDVGNLLPENIYHKMKTTGDSLELEVWREISSQHCFSHASNSTTPSPQPPPPLPLHTKIPPVSILKPPPPPAPIKNNQSENQEPRPASSSWKIRFNVEVGRGTLV